MIKKKQPDTVFLRILTKEKDLMMGTTRVASPIAVKLISSGLVEAVDMDIRHVSKVEATYTPQIHELKPRSVTFIPTVVIQGYGQSSCEEALKIAKEMAETLGFNEECLK